MNKRIGQQTVAFAQPPRVIASAAIVGDMEGEGPLRGCFDLVLRDDTWGEASWEKAECKMFEQSVRYALSKASLRTEELDCLLGGDLLNQIVSANYAARALNVPFLGLYGACSTMAEGLLIGAMLTDGGYAARLAAVATSHFSTAERQFRSPLELGGQTTPTAQRTVTGAGCTLLAQKSRAEDMYKHIVITEGTVGRVVDLGITDGNNMGAAMAPAAADTLCSHLKDTGRGVAEYDLIVTGDLGSFGSAMLAELCADHGVLLNGRHMDCGNVIFDAERQNVDCGGSCCGCSATVLNGWLLKRMEAGEFKRILFMATGALMSPTTSLQSESIPGIAHAVVLERRAL